MVEPARFFLSEASILASLCIGTMVLAGLGLLFALMSRFRNAGSMLSAGSAGICVVLLGLGWRLWMHSAVFREWY